MKTLREIIERLEEIEEEFISETGQKPVLNDISYEFLKSPEMEVEVVGHLGSMIRKYGVHVVDAEEEVSFE